MRKRVAARSSGVTGSGAHAAGGKSPGGGGAFAGEAVVTPPQCQYFQQ